MASFDGREVQAILVASRNSPRSMNDLPKLSPSASREERDAHLKALINPLRTAKWACDFVWASLETTLAGFQRDYGLNLLPDFQRGHVWSPAQQAHYIENVYRGVIPHEAMLIQFNCPHFDDWDYDGELPREMQIVDGLQRLTAVRNFLAGEVKPFGLAIDDLAGSSYDPRRQRYRLRIAVHTFPHRADLLRHYLDLNTGGTPHAAAEIDRVRELLTGTVL